SHYLLIANSFTSDPIVTAPGGRAFPGTVSAVAAPLTDPDDGPGGAAGSVVTAGVASLAVGDLLLGSRRNGQVLAALPHSVYLEFTDVVPEPRVIAVSPPDAIRLPNAIITGPFQAHETEECWAGEGRVMACGLDVRIVRWWDPSPVFGPVSRARLDHGL